MNEATKELIQSWLAKASHDLAAAKSLSADPLGLLDVGIYHCQQAAEKALKGYLIAFDIHPEKTHDVGRLVETASMMEPNFQTFQEAGERLTPFATKFRYPAIEDQPSRAVFDQAVTDAEGILQHVVSHLRSEFQLEV